MFIQAAALQARAEEPRLSFQTSAPWSPRININADVAMVYGVTPTTEDRIKSWKDRGYTINLMTGVAWGEYQDYLFGKFDGKNHLDEAQTIKNGDKLGHGKDVYYMSPGPTYGNYLSSLVKKAIDAGAESVYLEEPEFWVKSGYEPHFKQEWQDYYHEEWQDPSLSADAQYRSSKLKYYLYRRALADVFKFVKDYSKSQGKNVKCYVATHSLLNYASWGIVSPESSLLQVGCDGYIAQVWTGTARSENYYDGVQQERTFETAFLEYGQMQNLVRASGRDMWFLNDPVEDNPQHTWDDYRFNWECTLTASLLQPEVSKYEIMPWPERIFNGYYPVQTGDAGKANHFGISKEYQTELQAVIRALGDMKQPASAVKWENRGTPGTGLLVSDTLMFERGGPHASDPWLSSVYGLAMPLVKQGIPIEPVQLEDVTSHGFLSNYKLLLLTYEGQKPPTPQLHTAIADWVKAGGVLVVIDADSDSFNSVREWWNTGDRHDPTPRYDLFRQLGLDVKPTGVHKVGSGAVLYVAESPADLAHAKGGAQKVLDACSQAAASVGLKWEQSPAFVLRRGPYIVAAALADAPTDQPPIKMEGRFIPLFDSALPVLTHVTLEPGHRQLLVDIDKLNQSTPQIAAASCRVDHEIFADNIMSFDASGIANTPAVLRISAPQKPETITIGDRTLSKGDWHYFGNVLRFDFPNSVDPVRVQIKF